MKLNLAEKYVLHCVANNIPMKEALIGLCDTFLKNEENEKDNKSMLDLFLKSNLLNEKCLILNINENEINDFYFNFENCLNFVFKYETVNDFDLIRAISKTFGIDFKIANQLKKHRFLYTIENCIYDYNFSDECFIESIEILKNIFKNTTNEKLIKNFNNFNFKNKNIKLLLYNNFINEDVRYLKGSLSEHLYIKFKNDYIDKNRIFDFIYIYLALKSFGFEVIKKIVYNEILDDYKNEVVLIHVEDL